MFNKEILKEVQKEGLGYKLWRELFLVEYRIITKQEYLIPDEYIDTYGVPTSGNREWDEMQSRKVVHSRINISGLVEFRAKGWKVDLVKREDALWIWDIGIQWLEYLRDFFQPKDIIVVKKNNEKELILMRDMYYLIDTLNWLRKEVGWLKGWDKTMKPKAVMFKTVQRSFTRPGQSFRAQQKAEVEVKDAPELTLDLFLKPEKVDIAMKYIQRSLI